MLRHKLQPDGRTRFPTFRTRAPRNEALLGSCPFSLKRKVIMIIIERIRMMDRESWSLMLEVSLL